eukprot:Gb_10545 [translate_table: standard]
MQCLICAKPSFLNRAHSREDCMDFSPPYLLSREWTGGYQAARLSTLVWRVQTCSFKICSSKTTSLCQLCSLAVLLRGVQSTEADVLRITSYSACCVYLFYKRHYILMLTQISTSEGQKDGCQLSSVGSSVLLLVKH